MYAIIDVETTGFGVTGNKVTDIAIYIHDGEKVVDEFISLVNPECTIPYQITQLTGITNEMVANAPKFYEIAKNVELITRDCIFVAHNVSFDYGTIRKEYAGLGGDYRRKKLCTVRLSRKAFPGLPSYSLGRLCSSLGIKINDRHRAAGDALATVELFNRIIDSRADIITTSLKNTISEATLPPNLPRETFDKIPETTGVYYFYNKAGEVIYVGKAKNIRQRVLSHFRDKSSKEQRMKQDTFDITYEETGNELVALLHESNEIKTIYPYYNRAQKRSSDMYALVSYTDKKGVLRLAYNQTKLVSESLATFHNIPKTRAFIEQLVKEFELCPKMCSIQTPIASCFHYQIKLCKGICCSKETIEAYNKRVEEAITSIGLAQDSFVIVEKGRNTNESSVVLVEDGDYKGFGYIDKDEQLIDFDNLKVVVQPKRNNRDIQKILNQYFKSTGKKKIIRKTNG